ncbi:MAG: glycosyltransferase, partial [Flavobacteriaceae bacterium]
LWVRGNFFIPDARKYWVKPSVKFLSQLLAKESFDAIITTGPPHSVHLIGLKLKELHSIKWIADFRDPWTTIGYHKKLKLTAIAENRHKQLEKEVLNKADHIITTSTTTKQEFEKISKKPVSVITNGYDYEPSSVFELDDKFSIAHIGSLLTGRNPMNFWKVLAELVVENEAFRKSLRLDFFGVVSQDVLDTIRSCQMTPYVQLHGYVTHQQALVRQQSSQVLLLVEIDSEETQGIIPGKLFEYMASQRPILAIGPKKWEAGVIIENTNTGHVFNYDETSELKKVLLEWFNAYESSNLQRKTNGVVAYSRKALTKQLTKLF